MNEYVNQFRQVSPDKEGEIVNKLIGKKNILEVEVFSAKPLDGKIIEEIKSILAKKHINNSIEVKQSIKKDIFNIC